eukprot:715105-Rhodomonas_salina.1
MPRHQIWKEHGLCQLLTSHSEAEGNWYLHTWRSEAAICPPSSARRDGRQCDWSGNAPTTFRTVDRKANTLFQIVMLPEPRHASPRGQPDLPASARPTQTA